MLPLLQILPIDFDRSAGLLLLLPALWRGRHDLIQATSERLLGHRWLRLIAILFGPALILSHVFSDHTAASIVCTASWTLLAAAGLLAGAIVRKDARASRHLFAGLALGAAAGAVIMWCWWLASGRGAVPLYAHHRLLGLHMLVGAVASTALVVRSTTARQRLLWFATGVITWGAMLWSGGRAPWIALAGGLGSWFILRATDRKPLALATTAQLLAGLALSAALWTPRAELGWWHAFARTAAAATPGGTVDVSALTSTRSDFWRESVQRALKSPWLGYGSDAYRFLTPKLDGQQPHNFPLQLWLDVGLLGALPALALLGGATIAGWKRTRRLDATGAGISPWCALLTTLLIAGLLDGIFYHALTLLPALLALGLVLFGFDDTESAPRKNIPIVSRFLTPLLAAATVFVLTLHLFLFHALAVAPPPPGPDATAARILRMFPSTTFGLWTWLDHWHRTNPDAALAWARWAQRHASNPPIFHIRAAQYLQARGDREGALTELQRAETTAHRLTRPSIAELKTKLFPAP